MSNPRVMVLMLSVELTQEVEGKPEWAAPLKTLLEGVTAEFHRQIIDNHVPVNPFKNVQMALITTEGPLQNLFDLHGNPLDG